MKIAQPPNRHRFVHLGLMLLAAGGLQAASPPSVTVVATGLGTAKGGVALGSSGRVYIAGIAPNGKGYLRAYNSANQALWFTYLPGTEPPIHAIPTLSPGGESLYIGADDGRCYCLDALSGAVSWSYQVPVGTDRRIRSGEAYGVNRLGQVVGRCQNDAGAWRAFLYNPGPGNLLTDLSTLPLDGGGTPAGQGWTLTDAVAINDGGIIVGHGVKGGSNKAWILYPKCVE